MVTRRAFYLVNRGTAESFGFNPPPKLEELASTVVRIQARNGTHVAVPVKSLLVGIIGKEFSGDPDEIAKW
ncbi:DUF257 family protein [Thermococcus sp.]|uniref:DUF257 family protein n=1 Tax=Thermococcus sp. TaxID=35749 RepID=UPI0025E7910E|nr:DUF257 family protein [Thermococcus sp.]